MPGFIPR
ncbi:hypothetical protein SS209_01632 [Salmonella enterica subsp. enterica serovar Senftenberg str. SS209]|nr:hypothetical protein SS209_01632 [Salmonella enterica subsp. enterica serovar Senftenberg str. SS209]